MAIQLCAGLAAAASLLAEPAMGHMAMLTPTSRQSANSPLSGNAISEDEYYENAPYIYASGGVGEIQERTRAKISETVIDKYGGYDRFPLSLYTPFAANGNALEPDELAERHYVCGDPPYEVDDNGNEVFRYSSANSQWDPLTTYSKGQVMDIELYVRYYHKGHVEFSICDTADLSPDDVGTQECFNRYPLTRAADDDYNSPIDPNYPGRYYVAPPCTAHENGQDVNENVDFDNGDEYSAYRVKARYNLPEITCTHCILQMHYFTAHRCPHIGYADFNPSSWPSDCAPDTDDWMVYPGKESAPICGTLATGSNYAQEFWACSDITIESDEGLVPGDGDDACSEFDGIFGDHEDGNTCCAKACGGCAPDGGDCKGRTGGASDCCPYKIRSGAEPCSATNPAPCTL